MNKSHWLSILFFSVLFGILYWGCDTKSSETKAVEKSRALNFESVNMQSLLEQGLKNLPGSERTKVLMMDQSLAKTQEDSEKVELLKKMAGFWYDNNNGLLSGYYAKEIADLTNTPEAWSMTGTTFFLSLKRAEEKNKKEYALEKALEAFENAISLEPDNIQHRINRALCFVDSPPKDNPMMGIQQLLELNRSHPDNVPVILQLARLGLQTNQFEKAIGRLEKALSIEPENQSTICLLAEAYAGFGEKTKAEQFAKLCKK